MEPVPWPPERASGGTNDRLVPVVDGREVVLWCVYVLAPEHARRPTQVGHAHCGTRLKFHRQRPAHLRPAYTHKLSLGDHLHEVRKRQRGRFDDLRLFWAAWFEHQGDALDVEAMVLNRLGAKHRTGKWLDHHPEAVREAVMAAADELGRKYLPHDRFVECCRWRSTLPIACQIPRCRPGNLWLEPI
jgi:hypothetical protein